MEQIKVSADAYAAIDGLRNSEDYVLAKTNIADSMASLAALIHLGRDEDNISTWTDDLLKVLYTLGEYNSLVNALYNTSEHKQGFFIYHDPPSDVK